MEIAKNIELIRYSYVRINHDIHNNNIKYVPIEQKSNSAELIASINIDPKKYADYIINSTHHISNNGVY